MPDMGCGFTPALAPVAAARATLVRALCDALDGELSPAEEDAASAALRQAEDIVIPDAWTVEARDEATRQTTRAEAMFERRRDDALMASLNG